MTKEQLIRQEIINVLWSYDSLSESEAYEIASKILKRLKK